MTSTVKYVHECSEHTWHCVLIDGDHGRHELFSNVHPYTTAQLKIERDPLQRKTHMKLVKEILDNESFIHYHIFYNAKSEEVHSYYKDLKLAYPQTVLLHPFNDNQTNENPSDRIRQRLITAVTDHNSEYAWIIHGAENQFEKFIAEAKNIYASNVIVSSYNWLQDLRIGSNRIEYLIHNQISRLPTHYQSSDTDSTSEELTTKRKQPQRTIVCLIDDCSKRFRDQQALKSHQVAKHPLLSASKKMNKADIKSEDKTAVTENVTVHESDRSIDHRSIPNSFEEVVETKTVKLNENENPSEGRAECNISGCNKTFKTKSALRSHRLAKHSVVQAPTKPLLRNTTAEIQGPDAVIQHIVKLDLKDLKLNIQNTEENESGVQETTITAHSGGKKKKLKKKEICTKDGCNRKFRSLEELQTHQSVAHRFTETDFPDRNAPIVASSSGRSQNDQQSEEITCTFDGCKLIFSDVETLETHLIQTHPVTLRCPFKEYCLHFNESYLGKTKLLEHIMWQHSHPCSDYTCPVVNCKEHTTQSDCHSVLNHIVHKHTLILLVEPIQRRTREQSRLIEMPKWELYGDLPYVCQYCGELYKSVDGRIGHQIFHHNIPLICPFRQDCPQSRRKFFGLGRLRAHFHSAHATTSVQPMCFIPTCKRHNKMPFTNWNSVLSHIASQHRDALGFIAEASPKQHPYKRCFYDDCDFYSQSSSEFKRHLATYHRFHLRCPYESNLEDMASHDLVLYAGLEDLQEHIKCDHPQVLQKITCFQVNCHNHVTNKTFNQLIKHILKDHWLDIIPKSENISSIPRTDQ